MQITSQTTIVRSDSRICASKVNNLEAKGGRFQSFPETLDISKEYFRFAFK